MESRTPCPVATGTGRGNVAGQRRTPYTVSHPEKPELDVVKYLAARHLLSRSVAAVIAAEIVRVAR